jgi:hypothetical protein
MVIKNKIPVKLSSIALQFTVFMISSTTQSAFLSTLKTRAISVEA